MNLFDETTTAQTAQAPEEDGQDKPVEVRIGNKEDESRVRKWARNVGLKAAGENAAKDADPLELAEDVWTGKKPFTYSEEDAEGFRAIFNAAFDAGWKNEPMEAVAEETTTPEAIVEEVLSASDTAASAAAASPTSTTPAATTTSLAPRPKVLDERDEPYVFDQCTVTINIQLLPDDGLEGGREVIIGVSTHLDAPLIEFTRLVGISPLPQPVTNLLKQAEERMPEMVRFHEEARMKATETAKRAGSTQSKTGTSVKGRNSVPPPSSSPGGKMPSEQTSLFNLKTGQRTETAATTGGAK